MTYLDMVNNVLQRLRERTASTVNLNEYSKLIGILINDAKREVENNWQWSALRQDIDIVTTPGTSIYEMNDTLNRVSVLDIWDDTNDNELRQKESKWIRHMLATNGHEQGKPMYYCYSGTSADGDTRVQFYPEPDAAYNITVRAVVREGDLSADSDVTLLPSQPIVLLAYAKAIEERGEDAGIGASSAYVTASRILTDHIALDAERHADELLWREV